MMTRTGHREAISRTFVAAVVALAASMLFIGCTDQPGKEYQLRTDMYTQPSYRHNEDPRPAPAGTVMAGGIESPFVDSARAALLRNPYTFGPASADTARVLFATYCSPCHGLTGKGDGLVAAKFQKPPDLTSARYVQAPDGYIYSVARNGIRIMPPQYENTTARERWQIVTHIRSLQTQ